VALGTFQEAPASALLFDPTLLLFVLATAGAWVWMARRGEGFPLIAGASSLVILAVFNRYTAIPDSARYFQFLLPLIFVGWSRAGIWLVEAVARRGTAWRWAGWIAFAGVLIALGTLSLVSLQEYYARLLGEGRDNRGMIEMVQSTRAPSETPVLVDWNLASIRTGRGGTVGDNLGVLLRLDGRTPVLVSTGTASDLGGLQNYLRAHDTAYLIGFESMPAELGQEFPLQPLLTSRFPCPSCPTPDTFTLYWWEQ
jgi:hypothetical protein